MTSVVFENLERRHALPLALYRLLGFKPYYLRSGRGVPTQGIQKIEIPDGFLGSYTQRQYAIAALDEDFARCEGHPIVRLFRALFSDDRITLAFKKALVFETVEGWRVRLLRRQAVDALSDESLHFIPADFKDARRAVRVPLPRWVLLAALLSEAGRRAAWTFYAFFHAFRLILRMLKPHPLPRAADLAVAVLNPAREWAWGMDFMLDGKRLRKDNTLFIPQIDLSAGQKRRFQDAGLALAERYCPPSPAQAARVALAAAAVALLAPFTPGWLLENAGRCLKEYGIWSAFLRFYRFKTFVTYTDFWAPHVARNSLFNRAGARTFLLVDSINGGNVWDRSGGKSTHLYEHWCYLVYDVMISWASFYSRYQASHPQLIGTYVDIGAVWADQIVDIVEGRAPQTLSAALEKAKGRIIVAVFDSSYHDHGRDTYREGNTFLEDILRLADECPEVFIIFKEKVPPVHLGFHSSDPVELDRMKGLLKRVAAHPSCHLAGHVAGAAACIAAADVVVSYPFSSTTSLALAAGKKAFFYAPSEKFGPNHYDLVPGFFIRGYDAFKSRTLELLTPEADASYRAWLEKHVIPDIEPFADGKALERLRSILVEP